MTEITGSVIRMNCTRCGASILQTTYQKTAGLCRPCSYRIPPKLNDSEKAVLNQTLSVLENVGWIASLSEDQIPVFKDELAQWAADGALKENLIWILSASQINDECIENDGDYVKVVNDLAAGTNGIFAPTSVSDRLEPEAETAHITLRFDDRLFKHSFPFIDDYVDPGLLQFLNYCLESLSIHQRFFPILLPEEPGVHVLFTHPDTFQKLLNCGIIDKEWLM